MVRVLLLVGLFVLVACPAPMAAQASPQALLEDAAGDATLALAGSPVPGAGPVGAAAYPSVDLLGLSIVETRIDLTFQLAVARLPSPQDPGADGAIHEIYFAHNGREFRAVVNGFIPSLSGLTARLDQRDGAEVPWDPVAGYTVRTDASANTIAFDVPREHLVDAQGAAPFPGRALEGVRVLAHSAIDGLVFVDGGEPVVAAPQRVSDAMPDAEGDAARFAFTLGVVQTGHARLFSAMPFRASNGEATTFLYEATASNTGDAADVFELAATDVPAGYTLVLPVPVVKLEGGNQTDVPVLLTMPFGHQHGESASFILEMRSLRDAGSVGRVEMGVRFLAVPQPAGHHDTVYFHSFPPTGGLGDTGLLSFQDGYFNTLEQDPQDAGRNMHNSGFSMYGLGEFAAFWSLRLSPGLQLGVDVDPAKVGMLRVPIGTTFPMMQATLTGRLVVTTGGGFFGEPVLEVATAGPSDPVDIQPASQSVIEVPLLPAEGGGRVAFEPGMAMDLYLELRFLGPTSLGLAEENVYLAPGGSARLPLREFHDDVDEVLSARNGPQLSALNAQHRLVNPGEAVVFPVSVANPLEHAVAIRFELSGSNVEWAELPEQRVTVPAHGTAQASVVVRAPAAGLDLQRADLVLQAYDEKVPEARGLLRLVAEVDTGSDHPDDTAAAASLAKRDAPGVPVGLALVAVALLALARRPAGRR